MKNTKIFTIVLAALLACSIMTAKDRSQRTIIPTFREQGYKFNISYTNHYIAFQGMETSHGYMFNNHHYLGGGVEVYLLPIDFVPTFGSVFVDYTAYISKKKSTFTAGARGGFCRSLNYQSSVAFQNAIEFEPSVGWSWGLKSGNGALLKLACTTYVNPLQGGVEIIFLPKLSFGIEF